MSDDLRIAERIEMQALTDLFDAMPLALRSTLGARAERHHGVVALVAPGIPSPLFNRVMGLGIDHDATEAFVDELVEMYRSAGVKTFWMHVSPATTPATAPMWLVARGFELAKPRAWVKMLRGTEPPPVVETPFAVRAIETFEAPQLASVLAAAHGMPPAIAPWLEALAVRERWRAYGAFEGAEAVGGGFLFRSENRAWLGLGGTLTWHRGRGAQGAIMVQRIRDAIASGCTKIGTETGEPLNEERSPSLDNMLRTGFRPVSSRLNYELTLA